MRSPAPAFITARPCSGTSGLAVAAVGKAPGDRPFAAYGRHDQLEMGSYSPGKASGH